MGPDTTHTVELSARDLMVLRAGLRAYLHTHREHRELDGGTTHPEEEWRQLQRQVGELIWRLEEAGVAPGRTVVHSEEAVDPLGRDG